MKYINRIVAIVLVMILTINLVPLTAFAVSENTPKEEVVYINLNSNGSVKEIVVVNIFNLSKDGKIIDYGKYEKLRNMTTTDTINYKDETITIDTKAGKLYYEGKMSSNIMPWNIEIHYYMDGKEYKASDIAGKSGDLKITLKITENKQCNSSFYEGYALQAAVTLDTKQCNNVRTEGATIANIGSKKQLTYTILPNKGANIEILAKATKFEMEPIAINGVRLNLAIDIDDEEIQGKINEVIGAVKDVNQGADELNRGAKELYDGTKILNDKVGELYTGVGALNSGTEELHNGLVTIVGKNNELNEGAYVAFKGICSASQKVLNEELTKNGLQSVSLTPENYVTVLKDLLKIMNADEVYEKAYKKALAEVTARVESQAEELYEAYIEQNADTIYIKYIQSQADGLYVQVATQTILQQLVESGYSQEDAFAYVNTPEGQVLIGQVLDSMTDEQKQQIVTNAVLGLSDEEKSQIREGAVQSLTDEEKLQIRNGYIEQLMKSKEVTEQISAAVAAANTAAASVANLKGQLDNYSLFYDGLKEYTSAVENATYGADTIKVNMSTLYTNVGILKESVGEFNNGVKDLYDGTTSLKKGTGEFVKETDGIESEVSGEIDNMMIEATGSDIDIISFVSEKNVNIDSVQFVIQTEAIEFAETVATETIEKVEKNFWEKLLALFGINN